MQGLDIESIRRCLPHRYPFLLVDRVLDYEKDRFLTAIKNVTANEPFFEGHFPAQSIMPGVLIIEAMAQATGILGSLSLGTEDASQSIYYLVGVDKARFKVPVVPGDQLLLKVELEKVRRGIWCFDATATVDGKLAASARLLTAKRDPVT